MTHKKAKVPHALIQQKIRQGIKEQLEKRSDTDFKLGYEKGQQDLQMIVNAGEFEKVQKLNLTITSLKSQLDQQQLQLSKKAHELKEFSLRNTHKNQKIFDLEHHIKSLENNPKPINTEQKSLVALGFVNHPFVISNWKDSIKWISTWCFGLIAFFAVTPMPPEVLALLPHDIRTYLIAFIAFCGFVGRYLNQSNK